MAELCRRHDVSRETGYVWVRRYETEGLERVCLMLPAFNQLFFMELYTWRLDFIFSSFAAAFLPLLLVLQNFTRLVATSETSLRCDQPVAIAAKNSQIVPDIVTGIAVDVVFFHRLPGSVADAARAAICRHK